MLGSALAEDWNLVPSIQITWLTACDSVPRYLTPCHGPLLVPAYLLIDTHKHKHFFFNV